MEGNVKLLAIGLVFQDSSWQFYDFGEVKGYCRERVY